MSDRVGKPAATERSQLKAVQENTDSDADAPAKTGEGDAEQSGSTRDGSDRNSDLAVNSPRERIQKTLPFPAPLPARRSAAWPDWNAETDGDVSKIKNITPERRPDLPPMPTLEARRSYGTLLSFIVCVILPVIAIGVYYAKYASDQYIAEFRFAVTEATPPTLSTSASPSASTSNSSSGSASGISSAVSALVGGGAVGNAAAQNFVVVDYLLSRQAIEDLQKRVDVKKLYSRSDSDWWAKFDAKKSTENFVDYWNSMVTANYDMVTGLATARVRAFTPEDAQLIATNLVTLSEELVNRISMRAKYDAVTFAEKEVKRTGDRLKTVKAELTAYRNKEGVIDPNASVVTSNVTLANTLRASLVQFQTNMSSLLKQGVDADSPVAQSLRSQIQATKEQLSRVEHDVSDATAGQAGQTGLSDVVGRYEQLSLEWQYAQSMVISAMQNLDQARSNAAAQTLYLTPYVRPALPESSTYPKRIEFTFLAGLAFFGLWLAGLMVVRSVYDHLV